MTKQQPEERFDVFWNEFISNATFAKQHVSDRITVFRIIDYGHNVMLIQHRYGRSRAPE